VNSCVVVANSCVGAANSCTDLLNLCCPHHYIRFSRSLIPFLRICYYFIFILCCFVYYKSSSLRIGCTGIFSWQEVIAEKYWSVFVLGYLSRCNPDTCKRRSASFYHTS